MADVQCGLCEIKKNNEANATHGPSPVQKMFQDQTEAMLDRRGPGPEPGPVLTQDSDYSRDIIMIISATVRQLQPSGTKSEMKDK